MMTGTSSLACPDCGLQFQFNVKDEEFDETTQIICPNQNCNKPHTFSDFSLCFNNRFRNQIAFDVLVENLNRRMVTILLDDKVVGSLLNCMSYVVGEPVGLIIGVRIGQPEFLKENRSKDECKDVEPVDGDIKKNLETFEIDLKDGGWVN